MWFRVRCMSSLGMRLKCPPVTLPAPVKVFVRGLQFSCVFKCGFLLLSFGVTHKHA